jgi:hypothetical protein
MTTKQLSQHCRSLSLLCIAGGTLALASCVQDDLTGEKFGSNVRNAQLEAPSVDEITVTPSSDGSVQVFKWPVVEGAGGYHAILTNLDNNEIIKDTLIDNISFAASRSEDTNYQLSLAVLGNEKLNNKGTEAVNKLYNTFTPTFQTIPAGADLYHREPCSRERHIRDALLRPGGGRQLHFVGKCGLRQQTRNTTHYKYNEPRKTGIHREGKPEDRHAVRPKEP